MRRFLFPGSFDPLHFGHLDIIKRATELCDELIVLVAISPDKKGIFSFEERKTIIKKMTKDLRNLRVESWTGLTVEACAHFQAQTLVRGLRDARDFDAEFSLHEVNTKLNANIETIFLPCSGHLRAVASRYIKEIASHGGDLKAFVTDEVAKDIKERLRPKGGH